MPEHPEMIIGLALGSGSARGFAHIGIIRELENIGITPRVVCGTSVGAMVAASWATGRMDKLEDWAHQLTRFRVARFLDINARFAGFLDQSRFSDFLDEHVAGTEDLIEDCNATFGAVSTELATAREHWITEGSLKEAVWTSMSLPGLFPPRRYRDLWHTDGGLVNPVPVSLCHALGANFIIAANMNGDLVTRRFEAMQDQSITDTDQVGESVDESPIQPHLTVREDEHRSSFAKTITKLTKEYAIALLPSGEDSEPGLRVPSVIDTLATAIHIAQDRITRSRMAGDPPDLVLTPRLSAIGLLDLHRASDAIEEGRQCVRRMQAEIEHVLGR